MRTQPAGAVCMIFALTAAAASLENPKLSPDSPFELEYSKDGFGSRSHGIIERLGGQSKFYPLPQSTKETYTSMRPEDAKINPLSPAPNGYERQEVIGPNQMEGARFWFGNNYYDGEGMRGVGAFGYFDLKARRYQLYSPPEVAACEVSAILVEQGDVWVALDRFGEDIATSPCGLVRWNRETHAVRRYPYEFVVTKIARQARSLRLTTQGGYALLKDDSLRRFQTRLDSNGKAESIPVDRFPPPPSHN